jgi:hypothetical protein
MRAVMLVCMCGCCVAVRVGFEGYCGKTIVMAENVSFEDAKLEVENVK